jgi:hypothetical protein
MSSTMTKLQESSSTQRPGSDTDRGWKHHEPAPARRRPGQGRRGKGR